MQTNAAYKNRRSNCVDMRQALTHDTQHYSLFTLRKARSALRINGDRVFLRVNRLPYHRQDLPMLCSYFHILCRDSRENTKISQNILSSINSSDGMHLSWLMNLQQLWFFKKKRPVHKFNNSKCGLKMIMFYAVSIWWQRLHCAIRLHTSNS